MHETNEFLRNLALVMGVAAITTIVCERLRQPLIFGYILAGVIIGVGTMAVLSGQMGGAPSPPPDTLPPPPTTLALPAAMCEGLVRLSLQGGAIVADPDPVCLAVGRPLTGGVAIDRHLIELVLDHCNRR